MPSSGVQVHTCSTHIHRDKQFTAARPGTATAVHISCLELTSRWETRHCGHLAGIPPHRLQSPCQQALAETVTLLQRSNLSHCPVVLSTATSACSAGRDYPYQMSCPQSQENSILCSPHHTQGDRYRLSQTLSPRSQGPTAEAMALKN